MEKTGRRWNASGHGTPQPVQEAREMHQDDSTQRPLCACGCGESLPPLLRQDRPRIFINGHQNAKGPQYVVDPDTGCWIWQRSTVGPTRSTYGVIIRDGKRVKAHRFFYEKFRGPIPPGFHMDHLCKNKMCVNPDHLEPVSPAENVRRGPLAKLTIEDARQIRRLASQFTHRELAKRYGVASPLITNIVNGKNWKE
jgi:hypothetical protein